MENSRFFEEVPQWWTYLFNLVYLQFGENMKVFNYWFTTPFLNWDQKIVHRPLNNSKIHTNKFWILGSIFLIVELPNDVLTFLSNVTTTLFILLIYPEMVTEWNAFFKHKLYQMKVLRLKMTFNWNYILEDKFELELCSYFDLLTNFSGKLFCWKCVIWRHRCCRG